jgi:hypothetical protein
MLEQWERWEPISNLKKKYYIDDIIDTINGLSIIVSEEEDEGKKIHIYFKRNAYAYTVVDETFRMKLIDILSEKYGSQFYGRWTFFKVKNSPYLRWISEQSYKISESRHLTHFCLISVDSVMDIISSYEPEFILMT